MHTSPTKLSEQVARYFKLRADWEARRYGLLKVPDIEYLNLSRSVFLRKLMSELSRNGRRAGSPKQT